MERGWERGERGWGMKYVETAGVEESGRLGRGGWGAGGWNVGKGRGTEVAVDLVCGVEEQG